MTADITKNLKTTAILCAGLLPALSSAADIRGHWRMDDGVDLKITDSSGKGNHGQARSIRWSRGVHNASVQITTGGGIECGNAASLNIQGAISIDAWLNPWRPKYPDQPTVLRKEGAYALYLGPSKAATFSLWFNGREQRLSAPIGEWPAGQWRYLAGTFDGTTMRIYMNGELAVETKVGAGRKISRSSSPVSIGSVKRRKRYTGSIDEVRVAAGAFTADQVKKTFRDGMFDVSRKNNIFTSFYEKSGKREIRELEPGTLWIDAEDFEEYGGWWMDTQFVPQMGSPFLLAAGLHKKVENARTTVKIPAPGKYRLWVRSKNWLGRGHAPGRFKVHVNGKPSEKVFGAAEQRAWVWQDGGSFDLSGTAKLELEDLTGYYGRCDAIILTRDLKFTPRQKQEEYLPMRRRFVQELPVKDMGHFDFVVVGAGVAGCNAAIAAARGGLKVALIQNRPMVGGNNSSEMGVPVSGGSSIGKGRETGLNEEIGRISAYNFEMKWAAGAEEVLAAETNLTVFLNTHVFAVETDKGNAIKSVTAFNMIDGHRTRFSGDFFADCTGDGWLGYYAGAKWMLGRESKDEYGEKLAKDVADDITMSGSLMQHSILGYQAIDVGKPIKFKGEPWFYDMRANEAGYLKRPMYSNGFRGGSWWHENHGRNDDLWDPEWARDDLILASMSDYHWIKNHSTLATKAANYQLIYIPVTNAKRETRRLFGDLVLAEEDVLKRTVFRDRVGYFVWKLDIHHPLGIFSPGSPYDFETNIKPASIPFRILYAKDVPNMFMAGRCVSVTHVVLGTARVQGTTGVMGQIIGTAAALCANKNTTPRGLYESYMPALQQQLLKDDVTILHLDNEDPGDLARDAKVTASSSKSKADGPQNAINGIFRPMDDDMEMWIDRVPNNMWISDPAQTTPQWLMLDFGKKKQLNSVYLTFDTNLKTKRYISWEYNLSDRMPPECAKNYRVQYQKGEDWVTVAEVKNNYLRRRIHRFDAIETSKLRVLIDKTNGDPSARIYEIRVYNE